MTVKEFLIILLQVLTLVKIVQLETTIRERG